MPYLKTQLHQLCLAAVEERIGALRTAMNEAQVAGMEETKSSAGDKYETGRAMMHLEMEKLAGQLTEAEKQKRMLLQMATAGGSPQVQSGSVVYTSAGNYYLSVSAGVLRLDEQSFTSLSVASPLGSLLIGKTPGETITLNQKTIQILKVM